MPQKVAITDANIFIDLLITTLVTEFFELPFQFVTVLEVVTQEIRPDQYDILKPFIDNGRLQIEEEGEIDQQLEFKRAFSPVDRVLLSFAYHQKIMLLSGEREMRSWCNARSIEYHGILWVFDRLLQHNIIEKSQASKLLKQLISKNQRLPIKECLARIDSWTND